MSQVYLAVDLGGTRIRAARCQADGTIEARTEQWTLAEQGPGSIIERIVQSLRDVWPEHDAVNAIAVGAPGPIDPWTGVVHTAPNLPHFDDVPLRDRLSEILRLPVFIGNDANLAGLAEWRFGAARGHNDVIYLTISTGIGGGVIIGGRLLLGSRGLAGELGHATLDHHGEPCNCGNLGCVERLASGTGIVRQAVQRIRAGEASRITDLAQHNLEAVNVEMIERAAAAGDALADDVINQACHTLGLAITSFLHAFNPSIVVIGGGVSNMGARLFEPVRAVVQRHVMYPYYICPIVPAQFGGDVGLLGALALALDPPPQRPAR
jgi:glucokinase